MIEQDILALHRQGLSIRGISERIGVSTGVVRKVLIGAGLLDTPLIQRVAELRRAGMPQKDIAALLGISTSAVAANSPYERGGSYLNDNKSLSALRTKASRERKK